MNKLKIINDPIYGLISIPNELVFDLIEHPYFQRLSRIKQLGFDHLVFPNAVHSRLSHAIGATHLMQQAIDTLRRKGIEISDHEAQSATAAVLLHDIGHGAFSHALEHTIVSNINHESISKILMQKLNQQLDQRLQTAIEIFNDQYPKRFLYQLISSQLDVDRLDYLNRDSFFTGVSEGIVGWDRIIKVMNVVDNQLVFEEKGLYSIEKFLMARRMMYWQVYFHKTNMAAENLLVNTLKRANYLAKKGEKPFATPPLHYFLSNTVDEPTLKNEDQIAINWFTQLDDYDVLASIKTWANDPNDAILQNLSKALVNRTLPSLVLQKKPFETDYLNDVKQQIKTNLQLHSDHELQYFYQIGTVQHNTYSPDNEPIMILTKQKKLIELNQLSDFFSTNLLTQTEQKHYLYKPKF